MMFEKINKENLIRIITVLIIASIVLLAMSILTDTGDGRKQIIDKDGGTETALCSILSEIKGVGQVNVMIDYTDENQVKGVIVTAEGAGSPVVKNNIINGVATVFDIPVSSVIVFEKNSESGKD